MKLIDADKLIEELKENYDECELQTVLEYFGIYEFIKEQPTAFDVDKVVKKLEVLRANHYRRYDDYMKEGQKDLGKKHLIKFNAYDKAIEIVKAGGLNE